MSDSFFMVRGDTGPEEFLIPGIQKKHWSVKGGPVTTSF